MWHLSNIITSVSMRVWIIQLWIVHSIVSTLYIFKFLKMNLYLHRISRQNLIRQYLIDISQGCRIQKIQSSNLPHQKVIILIKLIIYHYNQWQKCLQFDLKFYFFVPRMMNVRKNFSFSNVSLFFHLKVMTAFGIFPLSIAQKDVSLSEWNSPVWLSQFLRLSYGD